MVISCLRPCQAHQVLIVQGSSLDAYQRAVSGFNQVFATISLPGVASIQTAQTLVLDPALNTNIQSVAKNYQDLQPNLIVAVGSAALEAARDLPVPIIYLMTPDPEAIAQHRPLITGIKMETSPVTQLAAIAETFPAVKRIGLLHNAATHDCADLTRAAERLRLTLIDIEVNSDREAILRLTEMAAGLDAMLMTPDPALITPSLLEALALLSLEKRIPLISFAPKYLDQGAAMAVFTSPEQLGMQAAEMAKRFLATSGPREIRPEYGKEATVLLNKRIIQRLGLATANPKEARTP